MKKFIVSFTILFIIVLFSVSCTSSEIKSDITNNYYTNEKEPSQINEINQTQLNESDNIQHYITDCAVFIDEQPIMAYFHDNTYYISAANLENYGFDLSDEVNNIYLKRNINKNIELAPVDLINKKKDNELFTKIYLAFESNQSVFIDNKEIPSLSINEQICIDIYSLSDYATISYNEYEKTIKLDYKKKEFEIYSKNVEMQIIEFPDAESADYKSSDQHEFISSKYIGEISDRKRNGFGVLEFNYIDRQNCIIKYTKTGYWKDDVKDGFQIYEGYSILSDENKDENHNGLLDYSVMRANYKEGYVNGLYLSIYIRYDEVNKDNSNRREGYIYDKQLKFDGIFRYSKIDDNYKYGYRVVSETIWDKGEIALSKEEILAKYDEIYPPLTEEEIKELDANILDDLPSNLEECYIYLEKELDLEDIELIKSGTEDDLWQYHHGLGTGIRNMWLWNGNSGIYKYFVLNGITNPDNMSGIIIPGFYYYLNNMYFDVEDYIYQRKKYVVEQVSLYPDNIDQYK